MSPAAARGPRHVLEIDDLTPSEVLEVLRRAERRGLLGWLVEGSR